MGIVSFPSIVTLACSRRSGWSPGFFWKMLVVGILGCDYQSWYRQKVGPAVVSVVPSQIHIGDELFQSSVSWSTFLIVGCLSSKNTLVHVFQKIPRRQLFCLEHQFLPNVFCILAKLWFYLFRSKSNQLVS